MQILHSILAFIVAVSILVTVHEYGHFWVARRVGVKILRFSIGFGRPVWRRCFGPDRTEFVIAALPLGGYVKMLDEREGNVEPKESHRAFNRQPLAKRTAVVLAGPLANFLFAILAYAAMYMVGVADVKPVIGAVDTGSIAADAGFEPGQQILAVDGDPTPTWTAVLESSLQGIIDSDPLRVRVRDRSGTERDLHLPAAALSIDDVTAGRFFSKLGLQQYRPDYQPVVREVMAGGAAERAGLRMGDSIRAADGQAVHDVEDFIRAVEAHPGTPMKLGILRDGRAIDIDIVPEPIADGGRTVGKIRAALGVPAAVMKSIRAVERYAPPQALLHGAGKAWESSRLTLLMFGKMLVRQASVDNISGPISIAEYAGQSASLGLAPYLAFLGIVSVSLFVLNMLPIPLLDGGHLMYYLMEFAIGRPVPEAVQEMGQKLGLVVLAALIGLAFYNDLARIF